MIKYRLIERGNPRSPEDPKKIYATPQKTGTKSLEAISQDIADISSLSRGDISNVLTNLVEQIPKYLLDGQSVKLGELGTMRVSFSSEGVDSEDEFSTSKMKGLKIIFTPGVGMKDKLARARFEKA